MIDNEVSTPRNVIVTGGALRIGGGISRRFAADGDNVLLVDIKKASSENIRLVKRLLGKQVKHLFRLAGYVPRPGVPVATTAEIEKRNHLLGS